MNQSLYTLKNEYQLPNDINNIKEVFDKACKVSYDIRLEKLDCSVSWRREETEKTYEEIFKLALTNRYHATLMLRDPYFNPEHYEFCLDTIDDNGVTYFIWIDIYPNDIEGVFQ